MSEKFKNLVDLWEKSCDKYADRELFGVKTEAAWNWMTYGEFKKLVDDVPRRSRDAGRGRGRQGRHRRRQPHRVGRRCYATYGPRRRVRPHVRGAEERRVEVHPRRLRRKDRDRREERNLQEAPRRQEPSFRRSLTSSGFEAPADDDHSLQSAPEKGRGKLTRAQAPRPTATSPGSSTRRGRPATPRA